MPSITDIPSHIDISSKKTNARKGNNKLSTNATGIVQQTNSKFVIEVLLETLHADAATNSSQSKQVTSTIERQAIRDTATGSSQSEQVTPTIERQPLPTIEDIIKTKTLDLKQSVAFEIMFCSFLLRSLETETIETGLIHDLSNNVGNAKNMDGHSNLFNLKKELAKREGGKIN